MTTSNRNKKVPCRCPAYPFPHNPGNGKCQVIHLDEEICTACLCPTNGVWKDFGIGPYEYQGALGVDTNSVYVSECCEAPLIHPRTGNFIYEN